MSDPFQALLERAWEAIRPAAHDGPGGIPWPLWSWRLTPPLPSWWPPAPGGTVRYYAYAEGIQMGLDDAVRVAGPWARVDVAPGREREPVLQILSGQLEEIGIQGVWPISAAEVAEVDSGPPLQDLLGRAAGSEAGAEEVRPSLAQVYAFWTHCNGVIARAVRPDHEAFFRWLEGAG